MRPSVLWMLTALALALTGLALQYPVIYVGRRPSMTDLLREQNYPPSAWWEPIVWPFVIITALMILFIAGLVWLHWLQKKTPKRWRPPMEDD